MIDKNNKKVLTKAQMTSMFVKEVELIARRNDLDYIDAITHYCKEQNIEIETAAALIKSNLKMRTLLENQAQRLNIIDKPKSKLPL